MKQGGRYGVRLKASAPSIHIIWNKKKYRSDQQAEQTKVPDSVVCGFVAQAVSEVLYCIPLKQDHQFKMPGCRMVSRHFDLD